MSMVKWMTVVVLNKHESCASGEGEWREEEVYL